MKKVLKRDGQIAIFDPAKIKKAILKSFIATDGEATEYAEKKAENIANYIEGYYEDINSPIDIEEIQDLVEKGLMATKRKDVAKAYILYREERNKEREKKSKLRKQIKNKLNTINIQNQNANLDEYSFGGRMGEANSLTMKDIALYERMSKMARDNHLNNIIYIHDLDAYEIGSHNCLTIPFDHLLRDGFNTRQTSVRGAQSISTAFQLIAVIFQLQSLCQFGGVSAGHLDWTMVPYVRKTFAKHFKDGIKYILNDEQYSTHIPKELSFDDPEANCKENEKVYKYAMDMTVKETKQAVEGMYHNLNTLQSRSGN